MSYDLWFSLINLSVLPAWVLLIFAPRSGLTRDIVHSALYPLILGGFYLVCLSLSLLAGLSDPDTGFTSIEGVSALFDHPNGVLIGWAHYLVFDLFVGAWIGRDAAKRGVTHWFAAPAMLLSFIFGPVGLFVYLIGRALMKKGGWRLDPE